MSSVPALADPERGEDPARPDRDPMTAEALREGTITRRKAELVVSATLYLSDDEARKVELKILDRAGRLTPGGLRSAAARAVMEVAPGKARERRETAAKLARVERWAEDSGNAALMGRELPPDEVLAADQRIRWWAGELRRAGLDGGMDELRARAFLDLVLGKDSRPRQDVGADPAASPPGGGTQQPPGAGPAGGFAGQVTLTVPLGTAVGRADRPGELSGLGPVDPWLARDLAAAAARNPKTTWCVTVTDEHGHAVGHGCARPEPKSHRKRAGPGRPPGEAGFSFTPAGRDGPPGRVRHLAAARPGRRAGPDRRDRHPRHPPLPAPIRSPGSRSRSQVAASVRRPARHLHQPGVPAARRPVRLRAQCPV